MCSSEVHKDKKQRSRAHGMKVKDNLTKDKSEETFSEDSHHSDDHSKTKEKLERKLNEILEKKDSLHLD